MTRNQDDVPTPRQTGSWAISVGRAQALQIRLDRAAKRFREIQGEQAELRAGYESTNLLKRRPERADQCRLIERQCKLDAEACTDRMVVLDELVKRFQAWPSMRIEDVDKERKGLLRYLDELTAETDGICGKLGKSY